MLIQTQIIAADYARELDARINEWLKEMQEKSDFKFISLSYSVVLDENEYHDDVEDKSYSKKELYLSALIVYSLGE